MKKKVSFMLLISVLLIALVALTGCGGGVTDPDVEPTTAVEEPAEEVVEDPAEEVAEEPAEEVAEEPAEEVAEEPAEEPTEEAVEEPAPEVVMADSLDINVAVGNNNRTLTYQQATPLELPDGTVIVQGDLKGTWQYIQEQLGVQINDVAIQDQSASEMMDVAAATGFDGATVFGGNGIGDDFMAYGAQGYFIRLNDYLDQMPNCGAYLAENPNIAKAITA